MTGVREIQEAFLVAFKDVASVDFVGNAVKAAVVAVGHDGIRQFLETVEVIYNFTAKEGCTVFEGWFVDDDFSTFGLDALHDSLNR